jgi:hypothetical protein
MCILMRRLGGKGGEGNVGRAIHIQSKEKKPSAAVRDQHVHRQQGEEEKEEDNQRERNSNTTHRERPRQLPLLGRGEDQQAEMNILYK